MRVPTTNDTLDPGPYRRIAPIRQPSDDTDWNTAPAVVFGAVWIATMVNVNSDPAVMAIVFGMVLLVVADTVDRARHIGESNDR